MRTEQRQWTAEGGWQNIKLEGIEASADLVIAFGARAVLEDSTKFDDVKKMYPGAHILMGSTSGEIMEDIVYDDSLVVTAIDFEKTELKAATMDIKDAADSFQAGVTLASKLAGDGLCRVPIV